MNALNNSRRFVQLFVLFAHRFEEGNIFTYADYEYRKQVIYTSVTAFLLCLKTLTIIQHLPKIYVQIR